MSIRQIKRASGYVHDIETVKSLSDTPNNVRLLSDRSLYILQGLSSLDVKFLTRYGTIEDNNQYFPVLEGTSDASAVETAVDLIRRDLTSDMTTELQCICDQLTEMVSVLAAANDVSITAGGSVVDPAGIPIPPVGPGTPWVDQAAYDEYKCRAANWIIDGTIDVFQKLDEFGTVVLFGAAVSLVTGIILSILSAGVFAGLTVTVAGAVIAIALSIITDGSIDLEEIATVITDNRDDLVCAAYAGFDTASSEANMIEVLEDEGTLSAAEIALVALLWINVIVNKLYEFFQPAEDTAETSPCAGCVAECPFELTKGTGTFRYDGIPFVMSSTLQGGFHQINFDLDCGGSCQGNYCLEFVSTTIDLNPGINYTRRVRNWGAACVFSPFSDFAFPGSGFPPLGTPVLASDCQFTDITAFTVTAIITPLLRGFGDGTAPYSGTNDCV